jgi:hypothetical protein
MNLGPVAKHWEAVQQALLKVDHGLQKATAGDMGGYLDKARAAMSESLAAMAECLAVARAEPDPAPFPAHASAELIALHDQINARVTKDRGYLTTASNVKLALGALQTALTELEQLPSGDEGGARTRLVGSLG